MGLFSQNIYIGFTLLALSIPLCYFGSIHRMNSSDFESYMYESTKHIEGSGTVFGYIIGCTYHSTRNFDCFDGFPVSHLIAIEDYL